MSADLSTVSVGQCAACGASAVDSARLVDLRNVLMDPQLGPVWWIAQFGSATLSQMCTRDSIEQLLGSFDELHRHLIRHEAAAQSGHRDQIRRHLDALFDRCTDQVVLKDAIPVLQALLGAFSANSEERHHVIDAIRGNTY